MSDYSDPVNIGNPDELTMLDLAREVREVVGSTSAIVHRELPEDDPKVRQPDITLARNLLGWQPLVPRHEGLQRTAKYFREKLG
jgi:nucleoside-diphosphate-sugar epimerase